MCSASYRRKRQKKIEKGKKLNFVISLSIYQHKLHYTAVWNDRKLENNNQKTQKMKTPTLTLGINKKKLYNRQRKSVNLLNYELANEMCIIDFISKIDCFYIIKFSFFLGSFVRICFFLSSFCDFVSFALFNFIRTTWLAVVATFLATFLL